MIRETLVDGEPVLDVDVQALRRRRRHDPRAGAAAANVSDETV